MNILYLRYITLHYVRVYTTNVVLCLLYTYVYIYSYVTLSVHLLPCYLIFRVNSKKRETIVGRVKALLAGDPELKEAAKRAVVAYLRSLHLASNKRLFCVEKLDVAAFAEYIYFLKDYSICTVCK